MSSSLSCHIRDGCCDIQGEENIFIPIHAYPVMDTSDFPKYVDFGLVPVGESWAI